MKALLHGGMLVLSVPLVLYGLSYGIGRIAQAVAPALFLAASPAEDGFIIVIGLVLVVGDALLKSDPEGKP